MLSRYPMTPAPTIQWVAKSARIEGTSSCIKWKFSYEKQSISGRSYPDIGKTESP
jgi:hypothetical protein